MPRLALPLLTAAPLLSLLLLLPRPSTAQHVRGPQAGAALNLGAVAFRLTLFGVGLLLLPEPGLGQQQLGLVNRFQREESPQGLGGGGGAPLLRGHSELTRCPQGEGFVAAEACRLAQAVLRTALDRAEEQYRINLLNREAKKKMPPVPFLSKSNLAKLVENVMLPTWPCPLEGRFGIWGEGGKWVCLTHAGRIQNPVTISIGSKGDMSFESEMYHRLNATIHTFDPTLTKEQKQEMGSIPFLTFHDAGLSGKNEIKATLATFPRGLRNAVLLTAPQLLEEAGATYIDIFKIDCEGCEYGVVDDMVALYDRNTVPFGQILMEIHFRKRIPAARQLVAKLEDLGYRMFHAEENAYYMDGYEIAFIHESLARA